MTTHLLAAFIAAAVAPAQAAPLRIDRTAPPHLAQGQPDDGSRYVFPHEAGDFELTVLSAVVLRLDPGVEPPAGAEHLGGPSWRLPVASPRDAVATALAMDGPGVLAFPDLALPIHRTQDVPGATDPGRGGQWYLDELDYDLLLAASAGNPETRVAVLDSGIDIHHSDLESAVDAPYDAFDDDDDPSPNPGEYCDGGDDICDVHGTAVSGVMVARADNDVGIVGMCPQCTLIPVKLLGEGASANTMSADVAAFEHAIEQDVAVINNSWGFTESIPVPNTLAAVIRSATTDPRDGLGALVVFAAGNDNHEIQDYEMQAMDEVLCVSAVDSYGNPTSYTNTGPSVDVSAPSATVTIAPGDEMIDNFGGTSGAAPVASGLASWAAAVAPELSSQELKELLISTADPSPTVTADEDGHHDTFGYGLIDAVGVMDVLLGVGDTGAVEDSGGCGCTAAAPARGGLALLGLLLPLAWVRRRR